MAVALQNMDAFELVVLVVGHGALQCDRERGNQPRATLLGVVRLVVADAEHTMVSSVEREQQRIEGGVDGTEVGEDGAGLDVFTIQPVTQHMGGSHD